MSALSECVSHREFERLNPGFNQLFEPHRLTIGLVVPIEAYPDSDMASMKDSITRAQLAEQLGFSALWLRDIPLRVASFGDVGQIYDPFVYLGMLAGLTQSICLGVSSLVLPLRHPLHTAKAMASVDQLSGGRLVMGVASGDRAEEYPALGVDYGQRGERFRHSMLYIRRALAGLAVTNNLYGTLEGNGSLLPRPVAGRLPLLVTGSSQQSLAWLAEHSDGWMTYPRGAELQARQIADYRAELSRLGLADKPVMEPLYIDLLEDPEASASGIHLGLRCGRKALIEYLRQRRRIGVNHIALNLRFQRGDIESVLTELAEQVLPAINDKTN